MNAPPPPYVMLPENYGSNHGNVRPPPYRRNVPRYYSQNQKKSGGTSCLKCICCFFCFLFFLILIMAGLALYFYAIFDPQMPSYKVESLDVRSFNVELDFSLYTEFSLTVKAENPNKNIGFIYGSESALTVLYTDSTLCSGKLPAFHQGHENTTRMKVTLKGKSEFGSGLQQALTENRHTRRIPLLVRVKAPVSIVVGTIPMRQFVVFVNCSLVVDSLSPNKKPGIVSSNYKVAVSF
ncbi:unnamed protein product [Ilex paraguariensis]|uniref:Late embryogenesis abundant protein LEA-2 subgroup domain-containing protein n=1 Tax=Ilex paraguariensis TaxID=185542 RepID=A0ABC8S2H9_9AQUA